MQNLVGLPYTIERGRLMPWGAIIKGGRIVRVLTEDDYPEMEAEREAGR